MASFSPILSLAYPLANLVAKGGPGTAVERFRSTTSLLLHNIFIRGFFAWSIGAVVTRLIAVPLLGWVLDECEALDDFPELYRNLIQFVRSGIWKRDMEIPKAKEDFPTEMWGEIGKRIPSRLGILRFRSVCKVWRSSLPCPTRFPLLVPPPPSCDPELRNIPYFITEVSFYSCKGKHTAVWFEEVDQGGKFQGHNLRRWKSKCDFSMISFMESPRQRRSKISFMSKGYHLRMGQDLQKSKFVRMIALISSSAGGDGVNPSYVRASDLSVVAHLSWGPMKGRLALLRLEGSPENRVWDTDFCSKVFRAVGTYKGQLCTLDYSGRVFLMDYNSLQMTQFGPPLPFDPPTSETEQKYLVESCGDMYAFHSEKTLTLCYKLSLRHHKWFSVKREIGRHSVAVAPYKF